jgi:hypothetical protein
MMKKSLFLVGEIGGNDYNEPLLSEMPIEMVRNLTPSVVAKISATITVSHSLLLLLLSPLLPLSPNYRSRPGVLSVMQMN